MGIRPATILKWDKAVAGTLLYLHCLYISKITGELNHARSVEERKKDNFPICTESLTLLVWVVQE